MAFEDVLGVVGQWLVATDALAALGAELSLIGAPGSGDPVIGEALDDVCEAAGLSDLDQLPPPQREMLVKLVRLTLRQAIDLVDEPGRAPGWTFTDPAILEGWGRGSMMVPGMLAAGLGLGPEAVRSVLDIGTGVGLLAVAAANVWPQAAVVGIDTWPHSLDVAAANVTEAGLGDRITLRHQDVAELDDVDAYDLVWFPTFFVDGRVLSAAAPRVAQATRPGGWLVLGGMVAPPDPLAQATTALRILRVGGVDFGGKRLSMTLDALGFVDVHALPRQGPVPLEFVVGRRPS